MTNFDLSGIPDAPPPPPIDPIIAREEKIANDTRVESELNRFIATKQDALFTAPDAYYRKQGIDAIDSAPQAIQRLHAIKDALLDGLANDYQRKRLGAALDAQMTVVRDSISRHVTEQSREWQRQTALDRIDLLAKEAALHHSDDELIDILCTAAGNAARAHTRVGDGPAEPDRENGAAATARSRVVSAATHARLDSGNPQGAAALLDRTRDLLDPAHTAPLLTQIQAAQQPPDTPERDEGPVDPQQRTDLEQSGTRNYALMPQKVIASSVALPALGSQTVANVGRAITGIAGRVAPIAAGTASAGLAAVPLLLTPTNSQGGEIDLGDGLRAQWRPGQRTATIERRINDGLFGTGIAADWKELPVNATYEAGRDGRPTLFVDHAQLRAAIGVDAADRVLGTSGVQSHSQALAPTKPWIYEIRIGTSTDGGASTKLREATDEEVANYCPNYPRYQEIALRASEAARALGLPNGPRYGNLVHDAAEAEVKKFFLAEDMLRRQGIPKVETEFALRSGIPQSYYSSGSSVLDVLEIYELEKRACVYDYKTGGARFPGATVERYAREAGLYVKDLEDGAYNHIRHIVVIPVHVP
jgi:hypothetical protein